uniref:Musashi RNA binding protein 1 n=1 Tax=Monodelphis domestica TaxID=13616 RepID=F6VEK6_MONDO
SSQVVAAPGLGNEDPSHPPNLPGCVVAEGLREYFGQFGEVKECLVMRDPLTKRSRGFGFVTFVDQAGVDKVLAQSRHELDSKTIDPKVAFPRRAQPKMVTRTKKIFVGGLSVNTTVEDVKQYFEQFGKVGLTALGVRDFEGFGLGGRGGGSELKDTDTEEIFCGPAGQPRPPVPPAPPGPGSDGSALSMGPRLCQALQGVIRPHLPTGYPGFQAATYASRSYTGLAPGYTYQFPGKCHGPRCPVPACSRAPAQGLVCWALFSRLSGSHPWALAPPPGSTPSRTGGFLGTTSPGPMAELYGAANQDSGVSSYISAASPAPSTGFGHSLGGPLIATAFNNGYH